MNARGKLKFFVIKDFAIEGIHIKLLLAYISERERLIISRDLF
jgi:hypothetical protein